MAEKNESTEQLWKIQKMKCECEWKKWLMSREKETNERYPDWFSFLSGLKLACAEKNVISKIDEAFEIWWKLFEELAVF